MGLFKVISIRHRTLESSPYSLGSESRKHRIDQPIPVQRTSGGSAVSAALAIQLDPAATIDLNLATAHHMVGAGMMPIPTMSIEESDIFLYVAMVFKLNAPDLAEIFTMLRNTRELSPELQMQNLLFLVENLSSGT